MRTNRFRCSGVVLVAASSLAALAQLSPPAARIDNFRETFHGPYFPHISDTISG
jgi:hypothetical protein